MYAVREDTVVFTEERDKMKIYISFFTNVHFILFGFTGDRRFSIRLFCTDLKL